MTNYQCKQCGHDADIEQIAKLKDESRLSMTITPGGRERLSLETVGMCMVNLSRGLKAIAKADGYDLFVAIESCDVAPNGEVTFSFTEARLLRDDPALLSVAEAANALHDAMMEFGFSPEMNAQQIALAKALSVLKARPSDKDNTPGTGAE